MIDQFVIFVTGPAAIWLSQTRKPELEKWASLIGLFGQPFWLYAACMAAQWGIFSADILYTYMWWTGFRNWWIIPKSDKLK
jgi:hypothetical protein